MSIEERTIEVPLKVDFYEGSTDEMNRITRELLHFLKEQMPGLVDATITHRSEDLVRVDQATIGPGPAIICIKVPGCSVDDLREKIVATAGRFGIETIR